MTGAIKGVSGGQTPGLERSAKVEDAESGAAPTGQTTAGDKLSLTDTVARLRALATQVDEASMLDTRRVDALRDSIAQGSYRLDAQRVAAKFVEFERLLHTSRRGA